MVKPLCFLSFWLFMRERRKHQVLRSRLHREGEPFSKKAKKFTSDTVLGEIVEINPVTKDRYGRTTA
jgi:endonuclease YncB( thermonuclease family)